ncbi:hypothetical protein [Sphingobium sp. CECT 9361]|uniref:hypothetical protein n=1 Tax=Sphingobium sp. CECT 9361 TaxID=2845384 RepID=UPI001E42C3D8|nr:hypothetical protein [Sphingobium sp. CECT 9361]CAH0355343.1 hypothetical protein SPH9361_03420 [Sphingobium sp. CECT 9361]
MFHKQSRDLPDPFAYEWMDDAPNVPIFKILVSCAALWAMIIGTLWAWLDWVS